MPYQTITIPYDTILYYTIPYYTILPWGLEETAKREHLEARSTGTSPAEE